jgi:hypothetical protein
VNDRATSDVETDDYTLTNDVTWNVTGGSVARTNEIHEVDFNPTPPGPRPFNVVDFNPNLRGARSHVVDWTTSQTINYANAGSLRIDGAPVQNSYNVLSTTAGTPVSVVAGGGTNRYAVGQAGSVKAIRSAVSLIGASPGDTATVDDSQSISRDQVTVASGLIGAAAADAFFGVGGRLAFSGLAAVVLNLGNANDDAVQLTPDPTTAFTLNGSLAAYQAGHGAQLTLDRTGVTSPTNQVSGPGNGRWTFGNRQSVTYNNFAATV